MVILSNELEVEYGLKKAKEKCDYCKKKINRIKHTSLHTEMREESVSPFFPQKSKRFLSISLNMVSRLNSI